VLFLDELLEFQNMSRRARKRLIAATTGTMIARWRDTPSRIATACRRSRR
jgi:hypothetical protein